ncbi:MAG: hypothetical protein MUE94_12760 [Verrucomicrobia bacterium]|nr:hypothetical protein [Verrucomicrobiota bacterium]
MAIIAGGVVIYLGYSGARHLADNTRYEIASRAQCRHNLFVIATTLQARGIIMDASNSTVVAEVLSELNLSCPSTKGITNADGRYRVATNASLELLVVESAENHDTTHMKRVRLDPVRYAIGTDYRVIQQ